MRALKGIFVFLTGLLATLYLLNIGAGIIDLVPDNLPIVGNIDEAAATLILLNCLAYFGLELRPSVPPAQRSPEARD